MLEFYYVKIYGESSILELQIARVKPRSLVIGTNHKSQWFVIIILLNTDHWTVLLHKTQNC